jgi:hypothetical protein
MSPARERTRKDLASLGAHTAVPLAEYRTGKEPLASFGYQHCRALVLYHENTAGLSHIPPSCNPEGYLDGMAEEMGTGPREIQALAIGGDNPGRLRKACRKKGIACRSIRFGSAERDIVVDPSSGRVSVHTANKTYTFQFPEDPPDSFLERLSRLYGRLFKQPVPPA